MKTKRIKKRVALAACVFFTTQSHAEETHVDQGDNSYFTLGEVEVSSDKSGPVMSKDILTSVDIIGSNLLENQNVDFTWQLFTRLPGVMVTDFNQGTTSGKFHIRGFNGEGEINAVKLLVDGIPSNTNDGNMPFLDAIFPLDIDNIELVRGTNDPRYGLHNIAGNANVNTRIGGNYSKARMSYGSFNSYDFQLFSGYESQGFSQNYFGAYRNSDGYRDHANSERYTFSGKWFYTPEDGNYRAGVIARWYKNEAEEPGYLTFADSRRNPTMTNPYNATDSGDREIGMISGHLDVDLTDELYWTLKSYLNLYDDDRFVKFSKQASQQERVTDETQYGVITNLSYRPHIAWLNDFALETGFDFQQQENKSSRYLTTEQTRDTKTRDQTFDFGIWGGYVQAMVKPFEWLKLVPAFRVDQASGSYLNNITGVNFDLHNYDPIWQPKFSAVITPVDGYSLYGNWGKTFQVGVGTAAYKTGTVDNEPSINEGWEVGVKINPIKQIEARLAYWEQTATGELRRRLNDPNNESDNLGSTKRNGFDAQIDIRPIDPLNIWFSYALQDAEIVDPGPTQPDLKGNKIDHIPETIITGGIDYQVTPEFKTSFWTYMQGDYFPSLSNLTKEDVNAIALNNNKYGGYFLLNASLTYQINKLINVEFQAKNLSDEYFEYVWYDGAQTLHSPGDGRAFYGAINMQLDY